eukprot:12490356-Heterocapsa_arctica.AAC.1
MDGSGGRDEVAHDLPPPEPDHDEDREDVHIRFRSSPNDEGRSNRDDHQQCEVPELLGPRHSVRGGRRQSGQGPEDGLP